MQPRIHHLVQSIFPKQDSKVLEIRFDLSSYSDIELIKKVKLSECQNTKDAVCSILHDRGYTPAEIAILTN
ncbi:hypothetical protein [Acinetobacter tianfuensis]|uniref:Uncharacterized protein n=1 Tax=Acinetobacter tianfuensis TaxID=2419603 RepID=A0A3A8EIZ5_9GAMM|nr:hypothetical protein [Acinetobacter tianfuensis]RKG34555.1 hypothetical protein D7V32_00330 [Acinetobacter tianfuensis]